MPVNIRTRNAMPSRTDVNATEIQITAETGQLFVDPQSSDFS